MRFGSLRDTWQLRLPKLSALLIPATLVATLFTPAVAANAAAGLNLKIWNSTAANVASYSGGTLCSTSVAADINASSTWSGLTDGDPCQENYFYAQYTGFIQAPATGTFTFKAKSDDGFRLLVNNTLLIEDWETQGPATYNSDNATTFQTIDLVAGQYYPLEVQYYEYGGGQEVALYWEYPGQSIQLVPGSAYSTGVTLQYDANGGTGTAPSNQTQEYGVDLTLADHPVGFTRLGYSLSGWNTRADGLGTAYALGGTYSANQPATLYAVWTPEEDNSAVFSGQGVSASGNIIPLSGNFTVETWFKPASGSTLGLYSQGTSGSNRFFVQLQTDQSVSLYGTSAGLDSPAGSVKIGAWNHLAFVYDGSSTSMYIDGVLVASSSGTVQRGTGSTFYLGARYDGALDFSGEIDQFKVWDEALSESEVAESMHSWQGTAASATLITHFDFNESDGTSVVYDRVGNSDLSMALSRAPVKSVADLGTEKVVTFPRSYLTSAGGWAPPTGLTSLRALVVAGGGASDWADNSGWRSAGGGAGGFQDDPAVTVIGGNPYSIIVGQGGVRRFDTSTSGQDSAFSAMANASVGGGVGTVYARPGGNGGSGGGGSMGFGATTSGEVVLGGTGVAGQGYSGGSGAPATGSTSHYAAGGGGGAGGAGGDASSNTGGDAGIGKSSDITGSTIYYAGGGAGAGYLTHGSADTSKAAVAVGSAPAANSGSGGSGGVYISSGGIASSAGASGIVIIRYTVPTVPTAVTGLSAAQRLIDLDSDADSLTLSWNAVTGHMPAVTSYSIEWDTDSSFSSGNTPVTVSGESSSSYTFNSLSDGQTYFFRVKAVNSMGSGTASSAVVSEPVSAEDYALDFDNAVSNPATATFASSADGTQVIPTDGDFSVEAWFNPDAFAQRDFDDYYTIVSQDQDSWGNTHPRFMMALVEVNDTGLFTVHVASRSNSGSDVAFEKDYSHVIRAGEWSHIAVTSDSASQLWKVYLNGVLIYTSPANQYLSGIGSSLAGFHIGSTGYRDASNQQLHFFNGQIDQVKVWDAALSGTQLVESMHSWGSADVTSAPPLLAHYDFNDFTNASSLKDQAGSFDLTINNAATSDLLPIVSVDTSIAGQTTYTFDRSYLTETGGWSAPAESPRYQALIVGGGGGGGDSDSANFRTGGSGGAGGYFYTSGVRIAGTVPVVVGQGGLGAAGSRGVGASGGDSAIGNLLVGGGGGGVSWNFTGSNASAGTGGANYVSGGSGGGGRSDNVTGFGTGIYGGAGGSVAASPITFQNQTFTGYAGVAGANDGSDTGSGGLGGSLPLATRTSSITGTSFVYAKHGTYRAWDDSANGDRPQTFGSGGATNYNYGVAEALEGGSGAAGVVILAAMDPAANRILEYNSTDTNSYDTAVDGAVTDLSGNGINATAMNSIGLDATTHAWNFTGGAQASTPYIDVDDIATSVLREQGFTVDFEADFGAVNQGERIFDFAESAGNTNDSILVFRQGTTNDLEVHLRVGSSSAHVCEAPNALLNQTGLHRYTISLDGSTCKMYRDGTEILSTAFPYLPTAGITYTSNYIGRSHWAEDNFTGQIRYIRFFKGAFTPSEIGAVSYKTVTLDASPGTVSDSSLITSGSVRLPEPTRSQYTNEGWYTDLADASTKKTSPFTPSANVTLLANWQQTIFDVTWDTNGGSALSSTTYDPNNGIAQPTAPTKTDYIFGGWSTTETSNQGDIANRITSWPYSPASDQNQTIYAIWLSVAPAQNVSASAGPGSVLVSWDPPTSAATEVPTGYRVEYSTTGTATGTWLLSSASISAGSRSHSITGLTPGTEYFVRVAAVYNGAIGAWGYPWTKLYQVTSPLRDVSKNIVYASGYGLGSGDSAALNQNANFSRIRYLMSATIDGQADWADVDFDTAFTHNRLAISQNLDSVAVARVPSVTAPNDFAIQGDVSDMRVQSSEASVDEGVGFDARLEIWPWSYTQTANPDLSGGSSSTYDYNDTTLQNNTDHGSFQVHNLYGTPQTVLAWNRHREADPPSVGFGPGSPGQPDWTLDDRTVSAFDLEIYANIPVAAGATSYTVTYNYNGADGGTRPVDSTYDLSSPQAISLPAPTKTGLLFGGWYSDAGLTSRVGDAGASYTPTADVTLYARWTNLLMNLDGSSASSLTNSGTTWTSIEPGASGAQGTALGDAAYFGSDGNPEGFVFDGDGDAIQFPLGTQNISGEMTLETWINPSNLRMGWNIIASNWFDVNGGASSGNFDFHLAIKRDSTDGKYKLNLYTSTDGTSYQSEDLYGEFSFGLNKWYLVGFTINASNELQFYINGEADGTAKANVQHTARSSYLYLGDARSSLGLIGKMGEFRTYNKALSASEMESSFTTRAAFYGYSAIQFQAGDNGSGSTVTNYKFDGESLTLPSSATANTMFTRANYSVSGWSINSDGSTTDYALGATYSTDADLTLYPVWEATTQQITFNSNDGSGTPATATQTVNTATATALNANTFSRTGYTFAGWNTQADGLGNDYADGASVTLTADLTLYAKWALVPNRYANFTSDNPGSGNTSGKSFKSSGVVLPTRTTMTVEVWFKEKANSAGQNPIISQGLDTGAGGFALMVSGTNDSDRQLYVIENNWNSTGVSISKDRWYHLAYAVDNGNYKVFLDGVEVATGTVSPVSNSGVFYLGENYYYSSGTPRHVFHGYMDQVKIWSKPLTISEVRTSMHARGDAGIGDLLNLYTFDDSVNPGKDEAGSSNLTINGTGTDVSFSTFALAIRTPSTGLSAEVGASYALPAFAPGGDGVKTFSVTSGTLPAGLSMNSANGVISGTPTVAGDQSVVVTVTDEASGSQATSSFTISVSATLTNVGAPVVAATSQTLKSIDVSWTAVPNASSYTLKIYNAAGTTLLDTISLANSLTSYTVTAAVGSFESIADGATYQLSLTAVGTGNYVTSDESAKSSVTTLAGYAITYSSNGATGGTAPSGQVKVEGVALQLQANSGSLVRTGFTFAGWNTQADGSGTDYASGSNYTADADLSLFAKWVPNTYTITYNYNGADGGTRPVSDSFTVSGTAVTLPTPTKSGYNFGGWYDNSDLTGSAVSDPYSPNADVTLYAKWTGQTYTVNFSYFGADGGDSQSSDTFTVGSGSPITLPTPTKTGYTFAGWYSGSFATLVGAGGASYSPTQNLTLSAKWTAIQYSVTYNADIVVSGITYSGSGDVPVDGNTYTIGATVPVLPNAQATPVTRLGYTFVGWVTNADGTGTALNSGQSLTMGSADVNLYPKWSANTYSISYNLNGGTGSLTGAPTSYTVGGNNVALPSSGFTKTGFNFIGWTKTQGSTTAISNSFSTFADVTLYAVWEIKSVSYTFDDGIADKSTLGITWPSNSTANFGSSITLPDLSGTLATVGADQYLFFGWSLSGADYAPGASYTMGESTAAFVAEWVMVRDVRYSFNGGTHAEAGNQDAACLANNPQLCTVGQNISLRTSPARDGYQFLGWKVQDKVTVKPAGAAHAVADDEYLFYAQWQAIDYTISFNSVGGSNNFDDYTRNIGQVLTMPNPGAKPHHSFAGWTNDSGVTLLSPNATFVVGASSEAFEAVWTPNQYRVVYDWQGAVGTPEADDLYTFGSGDMSLPVQGDRVRDGYNFAGWSTSPSGTIVSGFQPTADTVLYAQWSNGNFALTYVPKGGTMENTSASVPRGSSVQLPTPTRTGFVFMGWYDAAINGNKIGAGGAVVNISSSGNLYASWVQRSLYGVDEATLETSQVYTASSSSAIDTTLTHGPSSSSARVQIPAGSLTDGTKINVRFFRDTQRQQSLINNQNDYVLSVLVSWLYGSGDSATVPDTDPNKPITVTLSNSQIREGAMIYKVIGDQITELGRAQSDGVVTVELFEDPEIVIAITAPDAPQSVTATPGDQKATVSWTAPASNGGDTITGYTVTANTGETCTWTSGPLSCEVTGLTNGTNYTFSVVATNSIGDSAAATATAMPVASSSGSSSANPTPTAPGPATGIDAVSGQSWVWTKRIATNQVKVYIKFPEMGANYQINLQKNDGEYSRKMSKTINTTSDTDLRVVGEWYYLVRTITLPGEGRYRIEVTQDGQRVTLNGQDRPAVYSYR